MQKIWKIKQQDVSLRGRLSADLDISSLLAGLLINRGLSSPKDAHSFLNPALTCLHSFNLLTDILKAKDRLLRARGNKEKVLVFSDYDADGLTSLAVLKTALDKLGIASSHYIPHRLKEGYGLSPAAVKYASDNNFSLVITLDCGISDFQEVEELRRRNIDVIIIDHHHPHSNSLPPAYAVINPKRKDCSYPYKDLAGVGLSYKFASCLLEDNLEEELDLVCLGTVADVVPLLGENRVIVREGLKKLNNTGRAGLKSLIEVSGIKDKAITCEYVSFILAPRLNACGRIDSAESALRLLLCERDQEARLLARELQLKNRERQRIESGILEEAFSRIDSQAMDFAKEPVIVLHKEGWHQGVLGIVAARISAKFHRPAIIVSFNGETGKGSGRSIDTFHLFEGLKECGEYLQAFGGHKKACGLSILKENMEAFRQGINLLARQRLSPEDLIPRLEVDMKLDLSELGSALLEEINSLEPFGQDNPKPIFCSEGLKLKSRPLVLGKDTLKFWVTDGSFTYPAVGFGKGDYFELVNSGQMIDIAYRLSRDTYNGNNQLQLEIEDIRLS